MFNSVIKITIDYRESVTSQEKEVEKVEATDEDSKASENGDSKLKENGDKVDDEDSKDGENGDSVDSVEACTIKRKSTGGGDAPDGTPAEGVSPEKKAKLSDDKPETESNGEEAKAAA